MQLTGNHGGYDVIGPGVVPLNSYSTIRAEDQAIRSSGADSTEPGKPNLYSSVGNGAVPELSKGTSVAASQLAFDVAPGMSSQSMTACCRTGNGPH